MARLTWDGIGDRTYELGVSKVVLYTKSDQAMSYLIPSDNEDDGASTAVTNYNSGVAWNGVISIDEKPEGAEPTDLWTEEYKYDTLRTPENMAGTIEAYTYPEEFGTCDGSVQYGTGIWIGQQPRKSFAICYRTENGNEIEGTENAGYKIHVIYNMSASPSERDYQTFNDNIEATKMLWEFTTVPVVSSTYGYISSIVFDSAYLDATTISLVESCLYGDIDTSPTLPDPDYLLRFVRGRETLEHEM